MSFRQKQLIKQEYKLDNRFYFLFTVGAHEIQIITDQLKTTQTQEAEPENLELEKNYIHTLTKLFSIYKVCKKQRKPVYSLKAWL